MISPSGAQFELVFRDQHAIVTEVGGGLRSYSCGPHSVLDGYAESEMCSGGRGQVLIPWPNRIRGGHYTFGGTDLQLAISEPKLGNAIHGLVRWSNWLAARQSPDMLVMSHRLYPSPGYPFTLGCEVSYRLTDEGLTVRTSVINLGEEVCPVGIGWHPYLRLDTPSIDALKLWVPATTLLDMDSAQIPIGASDVADTSRDFRPGRVIGDAVLDAAYTDLLREADGRAWFRLQNPESRAAVSLWMGPEFTHAMIFSGDTVHPENRRRQGLAIEPMTCPPNAFASGEGRHSLTPGESLVAEWGIVATTQG